MCAFMTVSRPILSSIVIAATLAFSVGLAAEEISVDGTRFLKDGEPWIAEGVTLVGRVAPENQVVGHKAYENARAMFGTQLFADVRDYGADLVRYQFSQSGLDPQSPLHDPDYLEEVLDAVRQARDNGFTVIVSMQWQGPSGKLPEETGMPSASTDRAWMQIIHDLADDRGIMLEIYNEPALVTPKPENWETWREEMQDLIHLLRGAGSENVLLVGGLNYSHILGGSPELLDPLGQLGFAVHPFLGPKNRTRKQWNSNFGNFANGHPVMATAFMSRSGDKNCEEDDPAVTADLLQYLNKKEIGLVIWAFDLGVVRKDGELRNFEDFTCKGGKVGGAAEVIHEYFLAH